MLMLEPVVQVRLHQQTHSYPSLRAKTPSLCVVRAYRQNDERGNQ